MSAETWVLVAILVLAAGLAVALRPLALFRTGSRDGRDAREVEALARRNLAEAEAPLPQGPSAIGVQGRAQSAKISAPTDGARRSEEIGPEPAGPKDAGEVLPPAKDFLEGKGAVFIDSIDEGLTFKDFHGVYHYVNAGFSRMIGRPSSEIIGRQDEEIFGFLSAEILARGDRKAQRQGSCVSTDEIEFAQGPRQIEISRTQVGDEDGTPQGLVSLWRDRSERVVDQRRQINAMRNTIEAFAKSIAFVDPYLARHAALLARVATAVAEEMGCDGAVVATVRYGGYLSQVGKLGVDPEILRKEGRLGDEEVAAVKRHVEYTAKLLSGLDFGLPVLRTIRQMHERLDGSGYPQGLEADAILLPALILGACDVFCARISPRSYRAAITPEQAVAILEQNPHRYDGTVLAALQRFTASSAAADLLKADPS